MQRIVTPQRLARQAEHYHQLASMIAAGMGLVSALEHTRANAQGPWRRALDQRLAHLARGGTFAEAMTVGAARPPAFDLALIRAGEQSGRLDDCLRLLADTYRGQANLLRQLGAALVYPLLLLHVAAFVFPFPSLFLSGDVASYLVHCASVLLPLYVLVLLATYAFHSQHGPTWRARLEALTAFIPRLGPARRELALARLAAALEALLSAGVSILEAWELAADASGSPALSRAVRGWQHRLAAGETPADALDHSPEFPGFFAQAYRTGEVSGTLDDALRRLHRYYLEEGTRRLRSFAEWLPRGVYAAVALYVAYRVLSFWLGYFGQLQSVLGP
ncbi:MAG: hypothetical protein FJ387_24900 [Verrucomicrobia bacterium]|nr:hypothetical protein [Verrucomicrobiota bacterium]